MEYFNGTSKIGESISAPWLVSFECLKAGTHEITAVVTDNQNASSVSAAVKISVTLNSKYPDIFNLFPNPNSGQFSIDLSNSGTGHYIVIITSENRIFATKQFIKN